MALNDILRIKLKGHRSDLTIEGALTTVTCIPTSLQISLIGLLARFLPNCGRSKIHYQSYLNNQQESNVSYFFTIGSAKITTVNRFVKSYSCRCACDEMRLLFWIC